jgi:hypothetical protein
MERGREEEIIRYSCIIVLTLATLLDTVIALEDIPMISAIKSHLLDPDYERVKFYSAIAVVVAITIACVVIGSHCGGGIISDGAMRWAS